MGTLLIQVGHAFEINLLGIFEKLFETTIKNNPWLSQKKMQFNEPSSSPDNFFFYLYMK
jgi:hypothetical protein